MCVLFIYVDRMQIWNIFFVFRVSYRVVGLRAIEGRVLGFLVDEEFLSRKGVFLVFLRVYVGFGIVRCFLRRGFVYKMIYRRVSLVIMRRSFFIYRIICVYGCLFIINCQNVGIKFGIILFLCKYKLRFLGYSVCGLITIIYIGDNFFIEFYSR